MNNWFYHMSQTVSFSARIMNECSIARYKVVVYFRFNQIYLLVKQIMIVYEHVELLIGEECPRTY